MSCRFFLPLLLFLLPACKKETPAPVAAPKVVVERPAPVAGKQAPKSEPAPPAKKAEAGPKSVPIDLRPYGLFAVVDAPASTTVGHAFGDPLLIAGAEGVQISEGLVNLLKIQQEWTKNDKRTLKAIHIELPDALLAEVESGGMRQFVFRKNVLLGGRPYHLKEAFDPEKTDLERAMQTVRWASTLRQTPELKKAQDEEDAARETLKRLGAGFPTPTSAVFTSIPEIKENAFELLLAMPTLRKLSFINCGKLSARSIASLESLPRLTDVAVAGGGLNDALVAALGNLASLENLELTDAPLRDTSLRSLAGLKNLQSLNLSRTRVSDAGLRHLALFKKLQVLDLTGTDVAGPGLEHLKECRLEALDLTDSALTDVNVKYLSAQRSLIGLALAETSISDAALEWLAELPALKELNVFGTNVTADGVAKLRTARPINITFKTEHSGEKEEVEPVPVPVAPPIALDKLPLLDAAAVVARLGGEFKRDDEAEGKPIVAVDLHGSKATDADLAALRQLTALQRLNLEGCAGVTDAGLPYLTGLTALEELDLQRTGVKGDGFAHLGKLRQLKKLLLAPETALTSLQLAMLTGLPNLEVATFTVTEPAHAKLRVLAKVPKLRELNLGGVVLSNRKMELLKPLKNLETLTLGRTGVLSDRGLASLKELTELRTLIIPLYLGSDSGLEHLRALAELKTLELYGPGIREHGIASLAGLSNVERLRLDRLAVGDAALGPLRQLGKLTELSLVQTEVTDKGLDFLAEIKDLEFADLSFTKVTDAGLDKFKQLEELRGLRLEGTGIDGSGFRPLEILPRLNRLQLRNTKVNDAGMAAIALLSHLHSLDVGKTAVTNAGIAKIKGLRNLAEIDLTDCPGITNDVVPVLKEFFALKRVMAKGTKLSKEAADELRLGKIAVEISD